MKPNGSLPSLQWPATDPYSGPDQSNPQLPYLISLRYSLISSEAHPASYPMGTRGSFPGGKAAGAWIWLLTSIQCRGQESVELYLHSLNKPSWCGAQLKHRDNFTFINLTFLFHLRLNLPNGLFLSRFPTKILYAFLISRTYTNTTGPFSCPEQEQRPASLTPAM
jgi:hypothetical protein